ncbi:hypothetical protein PsorP6_006828 [Peronosclerospora sorghi]|uniref:Uncharacterized protein n=1 Tax=Peronosclerospora sorghi TaxID=230839 RepID=A0ACC0W7Y6_9STRA|nr:hypothetical protein PsorP6_006828 [Peronosclerospora sorghi]
MLTRPNDMDCSYSPKNNEASGVEAQQVPLAPPEEDLHATIGAAIHVIKMHAKQHGYGITQFKIAFDKHTPPSPRRYDFRCAKGGVKRGEGVKRKTGTRMTEFPFEVRINRMLTVGWHVCIVEASHNHEMIHPSAFAQFRRPNEEEKALIRSLHDSGSAPRFIIAALVERNPECLMSLLDVYNEVARIQKELLGSLSPIEALIIELEDDTWASHYTTDDEGHVNFLFFALHEEIHLAQPCPDVLFIDATYRTNRYNMPLIHFLAVMPICKTPTKEGFDESYELFKKCYADKPELIDYIEKNKYPVRHQFATEFTSKYRHLGHSATSRGENGHRAFRRYLLSSRHDLLELKDMWTNILRVFLNGYITELSQRRDRIYHDLNAKRWDDLLDPDLNKHVVPRGIKLLVDQRIYAKDDIVYNKSCGGAFTQIYGIPCHHEIRNRKRLSVKITKEDFHPHWHFERPFNGKALGLPEPPLAPPGPVIFKPHVVITRGRRRKDKSARGDPSAWELATQRLQAQAQIQRPGRFGGATSAAIISPHITVSKSEGNEPSTDVPSMNATYSKEEYLDNELLAELVFTGDAPSATQAAQSAAQQGAKEQAPLQPIQRKRGRPKGSNDRQPRKRMQKAITVEVPSTAPACNWRSRLDSFRLK